MVYILECKDGSLYTGITTDIKRRIEQHRLGRGAKYTRGRAPFKIVYQEICLNRSEASKREIQIKKMCKLKKIKLSFFTL